MVQQFEIVLFTAFIDRSQDIEQLPTNRRVAGEWDASEFPGKVLRRSMRGKIQQVVAKLSVSVVVDTNMGVPLYAGTAGWRHSGSAIRDGIPLKTNRLSAAVAQILTLATFDCGLLQCVMSFTDQQDEPTLVSQVMSIGDAALLSVSAFPFADVDAVLGDQFPINRSGIFAVR